MRRIVGLMIAFVVLSVLFWVIGKIAGRKAAKFPRAGYRVDLLYWFFTALVTRPVAKAVVFLAFVIPAALLHIHPNAAAMLHGHGPVAALPLWAQGALLMVALDLTGYWTHRLFHANALWRYHAVHHSSVQVDWLSATRFHPVNDLVTRFIQVVPFLALGASPVSLMAAVPLLTFWSIFIHADLDWDFGPLRYVVATPAFHRWHHTIAAGERNFAGFLPLWDLIFGTFHMPRDAAPTRFGTAEPVPAGLGGQLLYPFAGARRNAMRAAP